MSAPPTPDRDLFDELGDEERDDLEFKRDASDRDLLRKAICVLSNDLPRRGGGTLLIGVDKQGEPIGIGTGDDELLKISDFRNEGTILPPPVMTVSAATFKGTPVIRVDVDASKVPPVRFRGTVLVRIGPATKAATSSEERELNERRRALDLPFDARPVWSAALEDLDRELFVSTYLPAAVSPEMIAENGRPVEQQLTSSKFLTADGKPTGAGLLTVGLSPSTHIRGAYIQFVRYAGVGLADPVIDGREMHGNVIGLVAELAIVVRGHIQTPLRQGDTWQHVTEPDYPDFAIRELLLNAIVHRAYDATNAPIMFRWFDDRIEISNPGGPFGRVDAANFRHSNDYRNPDFAAAVKALGYVERFGGGISRVDRACAANGNPTPEFTVEQGSWLVTIRKRP